MITVFASYDARTQRHYLHGYTDGSEVCTGQMPREYWEGAKSLIRLALAAGQLMDKRGDKFEGDGLSVLIEGVTS
jgi:hypothetical protein